MSDGSEQSADVWPLPKFFFKVDWGNAKMGFQEVSGLEAETQPIDYRDGNNKNFSLIRMPGLKKYSDVTLKKGSFKGDNNLWDWFAEISLNVVKRRTVTITLLNEKEAVMVTWTLANAFPLKFTSTDLKSQTSEAAIETMVVAHEGLVVKAG